MHKARWLVLVVVLALVISGAGAALARQETSLRLMGWSSSPAEDAALRAMVDAFMEQNPDINVQIDLVPEYDTTIQAQFASGDAPNVFYIDGSKLPDWAEAGVVAPAGDNIVEPDDIYPSLLEVFTYEGELYCPPKDFSTMALQYNIDMFDEAGLDYPTPDWTWDDLRAAAEALTGEDEQGNTVVGLITPPNLERWLPFLYQAGGSILNEDWSEVTFDSEEAREALEFYVGMVQDGIAGPPSAVDAGWGGEAFGNGRAAMAMEGNWVIQALQEQYPDINWSVTELPTHPDGTRATMAFTVCYGVAANNDHPEESWELVNFLTGPEGAMMVAESGFGVMPARQSAQDAWLAARGEEFEPFVAGVEYAYPWQLPVGFGDVIDTFNEGLQLAFTGQSTVDDVIFETALAAEEVLERNQ